MIAQTLQEFYQSLIIGQPIIAIDHGQKKIGIAISNQECTIAMPLLVINEPNDDKKINMISDLVKTYSTCAIVIGLPISMNGDNSSQTEVVQKFAQKLSSIINLPIYLQDERLTSKAADNLLRSFGMNRKDRNANDDAIAASMILETTLNSLAKL